MITRKAPWLVLVLLISCTEAADTGRKVGATTAALGITGGSIPIPVQPCEADLSTADAGTPECDPTTRLPAWDGTYAELLAADAWSQCRMMQQFHDFTEEHTSRPFFDNLFESMGNFTCPGHVEPEGFTIWEIFHNRYLYGRTNPICNASPVTGQRMALTLPDMSAKETAPNATYYIPTEVVAANDSARYRAQGELLFAFVNLCMAQKLLGHLDSSQVLFASESEVNQLHAFARDRALTSVMQYSLLTKASLLTHDTGFVPTSQSFLGLFAEWRTWAMSQPVGSAPRNRFEQIGRDYQLAIKTLVEATEAEAKMILRAPAAQTSFGAYDEQGDGSETLAGTRLRGSRVRLLERLYGAVSADFDPYDQTQPSTAASSPYGAVPSIGLSGPAYARAATTDMSAPEVAILLSLAREADAFSFLVQGNTLNVNDNALVLLRMVETSVRRTECEAVGDFSFECSEVDFFDPPDSYRIGKRFGIRLEHALTLVRGIVEQVFGLPAAGSPGSVLLEYGATGDTRAFHLPVDLALRVAGSHSSTATTFWQSGVVKLDRNFVLRNMAPSSAAHAWAYLPFAALRQDKAALEQGFNFYRAVQEDLVGTIPALVVARHVLLAASAGPNPVIATSLAVPTLDLLDASIGPRSVIVQPDVEWRATAINTSASVTAVPSRTDGLGGLRYTTGCTTPNGCTIRWRGAQNYKAEFYRKTGDDFQIDKAAVLPTPLHKPEDALAACGSSPAASCALNVTNYGGIEHESGELVRIGFNLTSAEPIVDLGYSRGVVRETVFRGHLDVGAPRFLALTQEQVSFGRALSFGGTLNAYAERAWEPHRSDWSRPRYDGFDLPTVWNPSADASLQGGATNQEAHQHLLAVAGNAAAEATRALQTAYEGLAAQATDELALAAAEERGKTLEDIELRSLCGTSTSCDPYACTDSRGNTTNCPKPQLTIAECRSDLSASERKRCNSWRKVLHKVVDQPFASSQRRSLKLAGPVLTQLEANTPTFRGYEGGRLERAFIEQWSAYKEVARAVKAAMSTGHAALDRIAQARSATRTAEAELAAAFWESIALYAELRSHEVDLNDSYEAFVAENRALGAQNRGASNAAGAACSPEAEERALRSMISYSGGAATDLRLPLGEDGCTSIVDVYEASPNLDSNCGYPQPGETCYGPSEIPTCQPETCGLPNCNPNVETCTCYSDPCVDADVVQFIEVPHGEPAPPDHHIYGVNYVYSLDRVDVKSCDGDSYSVNPGPYLQYEEQCEQATAAAAVTEEANNARIEGNTLRLGFLEEQAELLGWQRPAIAARYETAGVRLAESRSAFRASKSEASSQFTAQLSAVQAAYDRLVASVADVRQAILETELARTRIAMEQTIDRTAIKQRMALTREYRSYDLWRARALSENARRLAIAARRSIESRYVVDLSELQAAEPFVEAPSIWSDEVYASDLKPPSALGTTKSPTMDMGGVYLSKLEDYVTNLGLFVNGYSVARPTSIARADTEVVQLPGPATASITHGRAAPTISTLSPESAGWAFYCEDNDTWFPHPAANGQTTSYDLSTVCFGHGPSFARFGFWLDPWGRLEAQVPSASYDARHNARFRRLAINLVGAGIRDCSRASDAESCYAEPFVRYDLRHTGPALVTSYDLQWHSLDVPMARVEGGKALAAEEWVDPVANGFNEPIVSNVARTELAGRPMGGAYELILELTPDVRVDRIERVQILVEADYWVRQDTQQEPARDPTSPTCGNGLLESPEVCDGDCPSYCPVSDTDECTVDKLIGLASLCSSECVTESIAACDSNDGCCPNGCSYLSDGDCAPPTCGDNVLNGNEQCDRGLLNGEPRVTADCDGNCTLPVCGDGIVNAAANETCDTTCPVTCDDGNACTIEQRTGEPALCNVECNHSAITMCLDGDGCCPGTCWSGTDSDCPSVCGNEEVEPGETCDGFLSCHCVDGNACTMDTVVSGSELTCDLECGHWEILSCTDGDGCCPGGCGALDDSDCPAVCGNGLLEPGLPPQTDEQCEGNCPTTCTDTDGDACTGAVFSTIDPCRWTCLPDNTCTGTVNGCCAHGCTTSDGDCAPSFATCQDVTDTLNAHLSATRVQRACAAGLAPFAADFENSSTWNVFTSSTGLTRSTTAGYFEGTASGRLLGAATVPSAYREFDTRGMTSLAIRYWRRDSSLENGSDTFYLEYSANGGSSYTAIASETNSTWSGVAAVRTLNLTITPSLQVVNFRLRFRLNSTATDDAVFIDGVTVGATCVWNGVGSNQEIAQSSTGLERVTVRLDPPNATAYWVRGGCPQASAGQAHSCATRNGSLYCWGVNTSGQLGIGNTSPSSIPVMVGTAADFWDRVDADAAHTCAIKAGSLFCWGENSDGELGHGGTLSVNVPTAVDAGNTSWTAVSIGADHACGIKNNGELYCWGANTRNALGISPTPSNPRIPNRVGTALWSRVSAGAWHTCAIQTSPTPGLYCWGYNNLGQVGNGGLANQATPLLVTMAGSPTWSAVAAGYDHSCGIRITPSAAIYCWGANSSGQLGTGAFTTNHTTPQLTSSTSTTGWGQITAGRTNTCAQKHGSPYCWGLNTYGQVGVGDLTNRNVPTAVGPYGDWGNISVSPFAFHVCGQRDGDLLYCWGRNESYQLGQGGVDVTPRTTPDSVSW